MGIELIERATDSFQRKQRKCLDVLEESNLFTLMPRLSLAVTATPERNHQFMNSEHYRLSILDGHLVVIRGVSVVGEVASPPESVMDRMRVTYPSMSAQVVKVSSLTGKAELLLE